LNNPAGRDRRLIVKDGPKVIGQSLAGRALAAELRLLHSPQGWKFTHKSCCSENARFMKNSL
jgi:hypothetical protein